MPVNNEASFLLAELRRMLAGEIRQLKAKTALDASDLMKVDTIATTLVKIVRQEKALTDEDIDKARQLSTPALRRAAKMRGAEPSTSGE